MRGRKIMAAVTQPKTDEDDEKTMATDVIVSPANEPDDGEGPGPARVSGKSADGGGFFSIHKKGQGYWTRLCTAGAAGLLIVFTIAFFWHNMPTWFQPLFTPPNATGAQQREAAASAQKLSLGICAAVGAGIALIAWRMMNKPSNVDFLIATDSEMKKVNWTSRAELIGSTKVVILFMFAIAGFLFLVDVLFGYIFYWMTVLRSPPF